MKSLLLNIVVIVSVLLSQYLTVVHAGVHDHHDHEHDELCEIYQLVDRSSDVLPENDIHFVAAAISIHEAGFSSIAIEASCTSPKSRSPPSISY